MKRRPPSESSGPSPRMLTAGRCSAPPRQAAPAPFPSAPGRCGRSGYSVYGRLSDASSWATCILTRGSSSPTSRADCSKHRMSLAGISSRCSARQRCPTCRSTACATATRHYCWPPVSTPKWCRNGSGTPAFSSPSTPTRTSSKGSRSVHPPDSRAFCHQRGYWPRSTMYSKFRYASAFIRVSLLERSGKLQA